MNNGYEEEQLSDVSAERAVLSGIINYGYDFFIGVDDIIRPTTFTCDSGAAIFNVLKHYFEHGGEKPDIASIMSIADKTGYSALLSSKDEQKYLRSIASYPVEVKNAERLAGKIRKLEISRELRNQLDISRANLNNITGDESLAHILGLVENPILDFSALVDGDSETSTLGDGIIDYVNYLADNPVQNIGVSTGFPLFDKAIGGGLRPGVSLVVARAKAGKSFFGTNVGNFVAEHLSIPTLIVDTELPKEDVVRRSLAYQSGVSLTDIEKGTFGQNRQDREKVIKAAEKIERLPISFRSVIGLQPEEYISAMRRWLIKSVGYDNNGKLKPCLVIYDYLKLLDSSKISGNMAEYQLIGFLLSLLHNFCGKHKVPMLSFCQANRDGLTKDTIEAVATSDRLSWFAINLSSFRRKTQEEIAEDIKLTGGKNGNRKLTNILTRYGEGHEEGNYINMKFDGNIARITELNEQDGIQQVQSTNSDQPIEF